MACEGVYADVQWAEESLTNEIERPSRGRAQKAENKEQELDKEKFLWLMNMYKEFKLDYIRHFRFNSSASVVPFGENSREIINFSLKLILLKIAILRRGATRINLGACPDLL